MLINSAHLKQRQHPNMLQDLLNDDSAEGRSNEPYPERMPVHQRITTTLTGSQKRQSSFEKQRLQQLQLDYNYLRRKLNTVDQKNERILRRLKNQPAERQYGRRESQQPKKSVFHPATPDNPESVRSLQQQIEMLRMQLRDKDMQLKERKLAQEQKEQFYRELLQNQEQEIACLELTAEAAVPMQRFAQALQNQDFATSMFRDEIEHKITKLSERLVRAVSLMKRCSKMAKEKRVRESRQKREMASSDVSLFKQKQIDTIISEYESAQKKMTAERRQLQQQLQLKRVELDQQRDKFDRLGQELKNKYAQLLTAAEQRHAESLDRYCKEVVAFKPDNDQLRHSTQSNALATRLTRKVQELERKLQNKELLCQQQGQHVDQLKQEVESLRESLTRIRFEKENLTFQLEKMRLNQNNSLELDQAQEEDGNGLPAQLNNLREENDALRQSNTILQRQNFQLKLKHSKLEELKRELQDIYKGRLLEQSQQNARYRQQREKYERELGQLRLLARQKQSQDLESNGELEKALSELVEEYSDHFISLVWQQYQQELPQAIVEIAKGVRIIRARQKEQSKRIHSCISESGLVEMRDHNALDEIVQRLVRKVQEGKVHHDRDKQAWRALEETLSAKIGKLQAQVKKLTGLKQEPTSKPAIPTSSNLEHKLSDMRKETEKKELLSKIQILEFDLQSKKEELTEFQITKDAALAERERMMDQLRRQLADKSQQLRSVQSERLAQPSYSQPIVIPHYDNLLENSSEETERLARELSTAAQNLKSAQSRIYEFESSTQRLKEACQTLQQQNRKQADQIVSQTARLSALQHYQRQSIASKISESSQRHKLEEQSQAVKRKISENTKQRQTLQARVKELQKHNIELVEMRQKEFLQREKLTKIRKSNEELIEKRLSNKLEEVERLKQQIKSRQAAEQTAKQASTKLQKQIFQLRLEVQEKAAVLFGQTETIARLQNQREGMDIVHNQFRQTYMEKVKKHKGRNVQANATIDKLKGSVSSLTQSNYTLQDELSAAHEKIKAVQAELAAAQRRIKELEDEKARGISQGDIAKTLQQLSQYDSRLRDSYDQLTRLTREKSVREQQYLTLLNEHSITKANCLQLQDQLNDTELKASELTKQLLLLNQKVDEHEHELAENNRLFEEAEQEIIRLNAANEEATGQLNYYFQVLQQHQLVQYVDEQGNLVQPAQLSQPVLEAQDLQHQLVFESQQHPEPHEQEPVPEQPVPRVTQQEHTPEAPPKQQQQVEQDIFGIAEQPYVPNRPSTSTDQVDFIQLFLRVKSAIERVLEQQQISVEFYSLLPVELEKSFEELIDSIRQKLATAANFSVMPPVEQAEPEADLQEVLDDIPEEMFDEVLQHHSNEVMARKLKESHEQIEELKWASEHHQRTLQQFEQLQQEKQEEQEARHITLLGLLKGELKEVRSQVDSLHAKAQSTKQCFFHIMEILFSQQKNLLQDLSEKFNHLTTTTQLNEKEHGQLVIWFEQYRQNAAAWSGHPLPPTPENTSASVQQRSTKDRLLG